MKKIRPDQIITKVNSFFKKQDFDSLYTSKVRIIMHFGMWLMFTILLFSNYYDVIGISINQSLFLSVRVLVSSLVIFYLFFYLVIPYARGSKLWIIPFLAAPICILIWLFINNLFYVLAYRYGFDISNLYPLMGKEKNFIPTLWSVFSFKAVILNALSVIYSLSPFFFTKILIDIRRINKDRLRIQDQRSKLALENIKVEKDFLKAQLNPHFLFNTLNNLYRLAIKKDNTAPEVVLNLSEIMGYTLYDSDAEYVSLTKELDFIENYFSLEKMRYPKSYEINLQIEGREHATYLTIAPLLTFTLIENAFKYGLKNEEESFVILIINITKDQFVFEIKNDRDILDKTITSRSRGIGIKNLKKRLHLIYPTKSDLQITDGQGEFKVSLNIALQHD
ncbi:MAG: histidine kinase [Sphingobacterium sp.]|jgi:sensor histidine kinase YesM|uniref:sensor histidine kinase n=1 Tax=Sphingobacterium sp. TaxID=341027 RepID=UPI002842FD63|nr:histidine kinase [Sphingobacterium sp.]MDR3010930.1 histidine kinase [Sphingobacterium sp.]